MEFEDFSHSEPLALSETSTQTSPPAERFSAIAAAVEGAVKGDFSSRLPVSGNDGLTLLAKNLQILFDGMRAKDWMESPVRHIRKDLEIINARLQYLIANTPAIIYSSVPSGDFKMTFVSENAWHVLGYRPEEMLADQNFWYEHLHPDDIPGIFSSLALVFTEGQRTYEYRFLAKSGDYLWMHDTLRLIRDANGKPIEVVGSLTDITDRKRMEETLRRKSAEQQALIDELKQTQAQLLQSEKMASIGQLAAGIAHEINNPIGFVMSNVNTLQDYVNTLLTVIDGYDQTIAAQVLDASATGSIARLRQDADLVFMRDDVHHLIAESIDGLNRVKGIVQSLKNYSHVGESDWQFADLHHGLDSTISIATYDLKHGTSVNRQYGKLPLVKCLASQLNQVFMNLLGNAAHAIGDGGVITVRTGIERDWVWIEIEDNGVGIPPENLPRIFDPFFTTKPIGSGPGLGLSVCYNIVKQHGGTIGVESEPGHGARFTVRLPVHGNH